MPAWTNQTNYQADFFLPWPPISSFFKQLIGYIWDHLNSRAFWNEKKAQSSNINCSHQLIYLLNDVSLNRLNEQACGQTLAAQQAMHNSGDKETLLDRKNDECVQCLPSQNLKKIKWASI